MSNSGSSSEKPRGGGLVSAKEDIPVNQMKDKGKVKIKG
jgi:hypothetical protein